VPDEPTPRAGARRRPDLGAGLPAGVAAYVLWGLLPLYFPLLEPAGPVEIIAHRVIWSLLFCAAVLTATHGWPQFRALWRAPRTLALLGLAATLLAVNWLVYVHGVLAGHVVDASLGYFINPLVTVALAVVFLHERLRPVQWAALGLGAVAVVVITAGYGRLPWIALVLAVSFGVYGLIKSRLGGHVGAAPGLAAETALLAPVAGGYLVWLQLSGGSSFAAHGTWHAVALASTGVVTAVPLLLFNSAARTLPLSVLGLLQYLAPVMQFGIGVLVEHEQMPPARWVGFALVWVGLVVLAIDGTRNRRSRVLEARAAAEAAGA